MRNENLVTAHKLREGNGAVLLPLSDHGGVVDEDNEVVVVALVEDFVNSDVSASHCDC